MSEKKELNREPLIIDARVNPPFMIISIGANLKGLNDFLRSIAAEDLKTAKEVRDQVDKACNNIKNGLVKL